MSQIKKILLTINTILFFFVNTAFAFIPSPLAPVGSHRQGYKSQRCFDYLQNNIQKIADLNDQKDQKKKIEKLSKKYVRYNAPMPSVEPQFILDLCNIITTIQDDEIKGLIFTKILFPLLHKQLIYDKDKADFWSKREHDEFDRINEYSAPTFKRRIYCDFFRVLKSKRGVCRNFTSVIKVIMDRIKIKNLIVHTEDHIFNAYLLNKESEWRVCDLTRGQNGETAYLFPPEERYFPQSTTCFQPEGYLDTSFSSTDPITVVAIEPKYYHRLYSQVIDYPDSYLQINFNPAHKKRETKIILKGDTTPKSASSNDVNLLLD